MVEVIVLFQGTAFRRQYNTKTMEYKFTNCVMRLAIYSVS